MFLVPVPGIDRPGRMVLAPESGIGRPGRMVLVPESGIDGPGSVFSVPVPGTDSSGSIFFVPQPRPAEQGLLTAAGCAILINVVNAWAANVWRADEPEVVRAFETDDDEGWQGRTSYFNVASQAVTRREWLIVADWLDEHGVGDFPDTPAEDEPDCERWLAWWQDREYLL
ncbi:hypothetical protein [Haliangium sp.]|uniref:hypothetical protein n=1 Tax=Haliangium sp. TaxID=2663208 RepID=UPI003D096608